MDGPPHEWPSRRRYLFALGVGLGWALLWFGLDRVAVPPYVFWIASTILFAPVLAILAKDLVDFVGLLGVAVGFSLVLAWVAFTPAPSLLPRLLGLAALAWAPTMVVATGLVVWRARSHRG